MTVVICKEMATVILVKHYSELWKIGKNPDVQQQDMGYFNYDTSIQ